MDEDKSQQSEPVSDSELYDITVRRDDTKPLDALQEQPADSAHDVMSPDEVEPSSAPVEESVASEAPAPTEPVVEPVAEPAEQATPVIAPASVSPAAPPATEAAVPKTGNSAGILVLQWLAYAFWGWFGFSLAILGGLTFNYFVAGNSSADWGDSLAYPLAAVIVMLVIALVTDFFYTKHEPAHKTGGASVIMLLHAVLYVLTAVGALVAIVFSLIHMLINSDPTSSADGTKVVLLTSALIAVTYGTMAFRTLFGGKKRGARKLFWLLMSILALVFIVGSIVGPAMKANSTKEDRLIESALPSLASDIQSYTRTNNKLPASLADVKSASYNTDNVQLMISKNLVTYKANTKPATSEDSYTALDNTAAQQKTTTGVTAPNDMSSSQKTYYYQLCVTYKEEKNSKYYQSSYGSSADYVDSSISTYSHPKGNICYDVAASGKYPTYNY
jgi:hypothetical protein